MTISKSLSALSLVAGLIALSACGGGGNGGGGFAIPAGSGSGATPAPATASVPASAFESLDGFISYVKSLVAAISETDSPLQLGDAVAPVSDTAEPAGL